MARYSLDDCVYICMRSGQWWNFWDLKKEFEKKGYYFGEPSISASIRNLRKGPARKKYNLPKFGEVIEKRKISGSKGFGSIENNWNQEYIAFQEQQAQELNA